MFHRIRKNIQTGPQSQRDTPPSQGGDLTLHPIHPVQPLFYPKIKAIVFFKKMMARKKKMTAFLKNAVVFQSKRGRV